MRRFNSREYGMHASWLGLRVDGYPGRVYFPVHPLALTLVILSG